MINVPQPGPHDIFRPTRAHLCSGVGALPTSYLVDAEGRIRGMLRSPAEWDSEEGLALLRYYLEEAAASGALDSGG